MNISGIRPSQGFYDYNSIKLNEIRSQQIAASMSHEDEEAQTAEVAETVEAPAKEQTFNSYSYAMQYRPDESFNLKGADSDVRNLDIQKAVSDLDKDQMLRQYQTFVSAAQPSDVNVVERDPAERILRSGENFVL